MAQKWALKASLNLSKVDQQGGEASSWAKKGIAQFAASSVSRPRIMVNLRGAVKEVGRASKNHFAFARNASPSTALLPVNGAGCSNLTRPSEIVAAMTPAVALAGRCGERAGRTGELRLMMGWGECGREAGLLDD